MRSTLVLCALLALVAGTSATTYINGNNGCKETAPGPVKNLKATATSPTAVKVVFQAPPGNPCIEYYLVELYEASNSRSYGEPRKSTTYEVYYSGLKPNTDYTAVVTAVSPAGKSSGASTQTRTPADPNACPQSVGPVTQLKGTSVTSSTGPEIRTQWQLPAGSETRCIAGYKWQLVDPSNGIVLREEFPYNPSLTINTGISYGRAYQVRVYALPKTSSGGKGPQGPSNSISVTTPQAPAPACPTNIPAPVGLNSKSEPQASNTLAVRSNWQAPSGVSASCIKEYVWTLVESNSGNQVAKAKTNGLNMYWSSSIKPDTKYKTKVAPVDAKGTVGAAATVEFVSGPIAVAGK